MINEIMINPNESDNTNEWIELYNPTTNYVDITGWKIIDNSVTDFLLPANESTPEFIPPSSYVIITDQDTSIEIPKDIENPPIHYMVDDNSICNGLGNSNDYILLLDETDTIIDGIEWGLDTTLVAGKPVKSPLEGNSIIRTSYDQTMKTDKNFAETSTPTIGKENKQSTPGSIHFDIIQKYIPKIPQHEQYSIPFSIKISIQDFDPNQSYQLKSYITGNSSYLYPASQTWTEEKWQYSDRYTHKIQTDETGFWSGWISLRFSKEYTVYQSHIQHNQSCNINIKIKAGNLTFQNQKTTILLDFDNTSSNGIKAGYLIDTNIKNEMLCLKDSTGEIISCYQSEPNLIDDYHTTIDGYFKLSGPINSSLTLFSINPSEEFILQKEHINIDYGYYHASVFTEQSMFDRNNWNQFSTQFTLKNNGNLPDTYQVIVSDNSPGFQGRVEIKEVTLQAGQTQKIPVYIDPYFQEFMNNYKGTIKIKILSKNDPNIQLTQEISCSIHQPDLTIPTIKTYDETGKETSEIFEGSILRIKAYLKNIGDEEAKNVTVSYYLDAIHPSNLLEIKTYETVNQYQKYPSYYWDTHQEIIGEHKIFVVTDYHNDIAELNELNNQYNITITLLDSTPNNFEKQLLITECYYYAHPTLNNEFVTLYNPTNETIELDNYYFTNTITKRVTDQKKIIFPKNSMIQAKSALIITANSTNYYKEQLNQADYEYGTDANKSIPQMKVTTTINFNNNGGGICLKDPYNHTIDCIYYGETDVCSSNWNGMVIPGVNQGIILKRSKENNTYQDTNSALDWKNQSYQRIGQSSFKAKNYEINASITPFVSPDNSYQVITTNIKQAESEILLNAYEFTSNKLTNLLISLLKRNISIKIVSEGSPIGGLSEKQQFLFNKLSNYGAQIHLLKGNTIDHIFKRYRFNHAKYLIIDQKTVIIHSGNFAPTGIPSTPIYGNREWGVVIKNSTIAQFYSRIFYEDWNPERVDTQIYTYNNSIDNDQYFFAEKSYFGYYKPIYNQTNNISVSCQIKPVLAPDNSLSAIKNLISKANESIYIQQLYIYPNWTNEPNPLIPLLIQKAQQGLDIRIILNYNPYYESSNSVNNQSKTILESNGIKVKYIYSNWSLFQNIHNKGVIIDNSSVLISSINWNENSFLKNREIGIIITHPLIAKEYTNVFLSDWNLTNPFNPIEHSITQIEESIIELNAHTIYIGVLFIMTFLIVARDWRQRRWQ